MNEVNYPSGGSCPMTLTQSDHRDNLTNYKTSVVTSRDPVVHPLRQRTGFAMSCWSTLLLLSLICVIVAIVLIITTDFGIKVGIPILVLGAVCSGIAIFFLVTSTAVSENRPGSGEEQALSANVEQN